MVQRHRLYLLVIVSLLCCLGFLGRGIGCGDEPRWWPYYVLKYTERFLDRSDFKYLRVGVYDQGLTAIEAEGCEVRSLDVLRGMPLCELDVTSTHIDDLGPLARMEHLKKLSVSGSLVTNLSPLSGLRSLKELRLAATSVEDIEPLRGLKLEMLDLSCVAVTNLACLTNMPLVKLYFDAERFGPGSVEIRRLRSIATLRTINHVSAPDFWESFDSGRVRKANGEEVAP